MEQHKFGKTSLNNLTMVHPMLIALAREILYQSPYDLGISDGIRTEEEQRQNVKAGVSWTMDSKHLPRRFAGITTPLAGAFDFFIYINGRAVWNKEPYQSLGPVIVEAADVLQVPIVWGGTWDTEDYPHIELAEESELWV